MVRCRKHECLLTLEAVVGGGAVVAATDTAIGARQKSANYLLPIRAMHLSRSKA